MGTPSSPSHTPKAPLQVAGTCFCIQTAAGRGFCQARASHSCWREAEVEGEAHPAEISFLPCSATGLPGTRRDPNPQRDKCHEVSGRGARRAGQELETIALLAPALTQGDARLGECHRGQMLLACASKPNQRRSPERVERGYTARSPRNGARLPTPRPVQQKSSRRFQITASSQHCPPRDTSKDLTGSALPAGWQPKSPPSR